MRNIDDKDLEIVELLLEDARRPYSEIAKQVDLSPPTVSDRIDRLQDKGIIKRFTLDIDESKIDDSADLLVEFDVQPGAADEIERQLESLAVAGRIYRTAESMVLAELRTRPEEAHDVIADAVDLDAVDQYRVRIVSSTTWTPSVTTDETPQQAVSPTPQD